MGRRSASAFVERSIRSFLDMADYAARAEKRAENPGLLQSIDPRVKLSGMLMLIAAVVIAHSVAPVISVFVISAALAYLSGIRIRGIAASVWMPALLFTGAVALPSVFLVPHGARAAALLVARSVTCATLSALVVFSTPWPALLKALRTLRVPAVAVAMLGMTYRYLFSILDIAKDMLESRRSRTVGALSAADQRRMAAASAGVLLSRSVQLSRDIHLAMLSRGYRGEAFTIDDRAVTRADWASLAAFAGVAAIVIAFGR